MFDGKVTLVGAGESTEKKSGDVTIQAQPRNFSTGTTGFYYRDRVVINGVSHHVQITISHK
jgi:hypothetical protein